MANDIDIWNDIEELEKSGKQQEADDLLKIYHYVYIEDGHELAKRLQKKFIKKYGYNPKVI